MTSNARAIGTQLRVDLTDVGASVVDLTDDLVAVVPNGAPVTLKDSGGGVIGTGYARACTGILSLGTEQSPDEPMNIACGGAGWSCDADWSIAGGLAVKSVGGANSWFYSYQSMTTGQLVKAVIDCSSYTAGLYRIDIDGNPIGSVFASGGVKTQYFTIPSLSGSPYFGIEADAAGNLSVTSFSFKRVTKVGSTGLNIYKNASLTTRGWATTGAGDANDCDSLEYSHP